MLKLYKILLSCYKDKPLEYCIIATGLDKTKSKFLPVLGNQRETYNIKNMCWQIDSSLSDFIARDDEMLEPFRSRILSVADVFGSMGVTALVKKSNSLSLIRLLS
ncbi:hypothetical protein AAID98_00665 [Campylobacter coli]